jgi:hypothetical protein
MASGNTGVVLTSTSGFQVLVWYEISGNFWIKDISADEWYFNAFANGWNFERLIEGEACGQIRTSEDVKDRDLLAKLRQVKKQYIDTYVAA